MHTDTISIGANVADFCGIKTYTSDQPWLTILTPANPLTEDFQIQVATNDFSLTGKKPANIVIGFQNTDYTQTITSEFVVRF